MDLCGAGQGFVSSGAFSSFGVAKMGRTSVATKNNQADHVYKVIELVGTSEKSIDDAVKTAISRASATLKHLRWFEVVQTRGHIEDGKIGHYQVTLKVGFTLAG
jgi:flavin-binding protein dodecin